MNKKKIAIIVLIAAIIVTVGIILGITFLGNDGSDGYMTLDKYRVTEQHFTYFCIRGYDAAYEATGIADSSIWDAEIDGVNTEKWIKNYATEKAKRFLLINKLFDDEGLKFTQDELFAIDDEVEEAWLYSGISKSYERRGISQIVYEDIITTDKKAEKLTEHYSEELSKSISEDDIEAYLTDNYASVTYFAMSYVNENSESTLDEYEAYCKEVENGKSLEALVKELDESGNKFIVTSINGSRSDMIITKRGSDFPLAYVDELFAAEVGTVIPFDDTAANIYVLSQRTDILADDYYLNMYREDIVDALLANRYEDKLNEEADSYNVDTAKIAISNLDIEDMFS